MKKKKFTVSFSIRSSSTGTVESKTAAISTVAGHSISTESTTGKGLKRCVEDEVVVDEEESKGYWPMALMIRAKIWKKKASQFKSALQTCIDRGAYTSAPVNSAIRKYRTIHDTQKK